MRKTLVSKASIDQTANRLVVLDLDVELMLRLMLSEHAQFWAAVQQREVLMTEEAVTQGNVALFLRSFLPTFLILPAQKSEVTRCSLPTGQLLRLPHRQHQNNRKLVNSKTHNSAAHGVLLHVSGMLVR